MRLVTKQKGFQTSNWLPDIKLPASVRNIIMMELRFQIAGSMEFVLIFLLQPRSGLSHLCPFLLPYAAAVRRQGRWGIARVRLRTSG